MMDPWGGVSLIYWYRVKLILFFPFLVSYEGKSDHMSLGLTVDTALYHCPLMDTDIREIE